MWCVRTLSPALCSAGAVDLGDRQCRWRKVHRMWAPCIPWPGRDRFGWTMNRAKVETLAAEMRDRLAFLCGYVENEPEVRDLFDLIVCLAVDYATLRRRLLSRTTNAFGHRPEELAAALNLNICIRSMYRRLGATI